MESTPPARSSRLYKKDPRVPDYYRDWSFWPPHLYQPGSYDALTQPVKETLSASQDTFDGIRLDLSKTISEGWSSQHSLSLSSDQNVQKYFFTLSGSYSNDGQILGRIDSDWNVAGKWAHRLKDLVIKLSGQASLEQQGSNFSVEAQYQGSDYFTDLMWSPAGMYRAAYHQAISQRLSLGGELAYNHPQGASFGSIGGRYMTPNWATTFTLAFPALVLGFVRLIGSNCRFAVENTTQWNHQTNAFESKTDVGFSAAFPTAMVSGSIDTQWHARTVLQSSVGDFEDGLMLGLLGDLDYKKKKFGVGLNLSCQIS